MQKIRKGDKVVVLDRQGQGPFRRSPPGYAEGRPGCCSWRQHGEASPAPDPDARKPASSTRKRRSICRTSRSPTKDGKPTRVGFKIDGDKKVRVAKRSGDVIDG